MENHDLDDMTKGWFVGPFEPTLYKTDQFECAAKFYKKGESEGKHYHKIATEFTLIASGSVRMNDQEYGEGAIIKILPGEATDFEALTDVKTFVVKIPAVLGDKYEC